MKIKILAISSMVIMLMLAACSASQPATQDTSGGNNSSQALAQGATQSQAQGQDQGQGQGGPNGPQGNSLESRLAIGILKLEGTKQALTADQAKQLLPLWQKIKDLSGNNSANQTDMQTAYQQIEKILTPDQTQAIQAMSLNQTDIQDLMKSLGIQFTPGQGGPGGPGRPGNGTAFPTRSPEQMATRQAQQTQSPNGGGNRGGGFGFNRMFVDPVIQLLQKRSTGG